MQYISSLDLYMTHFSLLISRLWTHQMIIQKFVFDLLFKSHTFCLTSHTQKIFLCDKIMYIIPPRNPIYIRPHILDQLSIFFLCSGNFSRKTSQCTWPILWSISLLLVHVRRDCFLLAHSFNTYLLNNNYVPHSELVIMGGRRDA